LRQAVEFDPTLGAEVAWLLVELGREYTYEGAYDEALAALRQAVELDPTLELDPEAEVAGALVEQAREYAYEGEYRRCVR
jgi:tetratricopeptide (TPR) repeat protein